MARKIHVPRLILSFLLAASVVCCLSPLCGKMISRMDPNRRMIVVRVLARNQYTGGSEVWLAASQPDIDLEDALERSHFSGNLEYRLAADYGYGLDFLISYNENIGSEIIIDTPLGGGGGVNLLLYKHLLGGTIEVEYAGNRQQIESYSETPEVVSIDLDPAASRISRYLIQAAAACLLTMLLYRFLPHCKAAEANEECTGTRDPSIDLVRAVSAFLVVFVHSFLAGGYYNAPLSGRGMVVLTFFRWAALTCVPLFMLLTGYLCIDKKEIKRTYLGFLPNFLLFVLVSLFRAVFLKGIYAESGITLEGLLSELIGMESAWYVKMYIGLLLLMPFLNRMWERLRQEEKQILIAALLLMTMGRSVLGSYFPNYWVALYPLTYYFTGAYLRERALPLAKNRLLLLFAGVLLLETALTHTSTAASGTFDWSLLGGFECSYNAVPVFLSSMLLFSALRMVKIKNIYLQKFLKTVGRNTLGIYLLSGIVDNLIYPPLQRIYVTPQAFAVVQLPAAFASYLISLVLSILLTVGISAGLAHYRRAHTAADKV